MKTHLPKLNLGGWSRLLAGYAGVVALMALPCQGGSVWIAPRTPNEPPLPLPGIKLVFIYSPDFIVERTTDDTGCYDLHSVAGGMFDGPIVKLQLPPGFSMVPHGLMSFKQWATNDVVITSAAVYGKVLRMGQGLGGVEVKARTSTGLAFSGWSSGTDGSFIITNLLYLPYLTPESPDWTFTTAAGPGPYLQTSVKPA